MLPRLILTSFATSMSFYVVLGGRVRFEQDVGDGATIIIGEAPAGGFFGEMGLIDDMPRSATVVTVEPTECALLAKWDFRNELREDPDIALALLPVLSQRIRELEAQRSQGNVAASRGRLASAAASPSSMNRLPS